jgi:AcrR family transcriptional regulator
MTGDKRTAILDATLGLISQNGFHGTSMSMIAKEAGVSAGIIYHYFESKDDLIDELFVALKQDFGRALSDGYDPELPLREQAQVVWVNAVRYYLQHPQETIFMEQYIRSPYYRAEIEERVADSALPVFQFLDQVRQEQIIKDLPDLVFYALTIEVASSLAQKHAAGLLVMDDALIEQVAEACWDAIKR